MQVTTSTPDTPHLRTMTNKERGEAIKRRRLGLDIGSHTQFAAATGGRFPRATLKRAEEGTASDNTYDLLELWLDRAEGLAPPAVPEAEPEPAEFIRIEVHGVYGVDQIIFAAPVDRPDEAAEMIRKVMEGIRAQAGEGQ